MNFVKNKKFICFIILLFSCFFILSTDVCLAQGGIIPDDGKKATGDYGLNDFIQLALNASGWILGIVGSLALLMFVYGGVIFLISAGSSEKVTQAKDIIVGAVIGIAIVFTSYMIIGFVFKATGADTTSTAWSNVSWFSDKQAGKD